MEYDRLTGKSECGYNNLDACLNCDLEMDCGLCPYWAKALDRLAELEAKIEQGTLIELPCKVGDTVYKIMHVCGHRRIVQFEVSRISIYEKDICVFFHKSKESWHEWCTKPHHFGSNIFLTREEAEKRLLELQGDK